MKTLALACSLLALLSATAQSDTILNKEHSHYKFSKVYEVSNTPVKNQCRTSTCWSFSTLSFLESELLRKGKGTHDLSEMFIVRCAYIEKAIQYIRMNGKINFDEGGEPHDIPAIIRKYGIVPDAVYPGLNYGEEQHKHYEMVAMLKGALDKLKDNPQGTYTPVWTSAIAGIVDAYFGKYPDSFSYNGKKYTPKTYAASLELNMDDYVLLTSFTHHPYYSQFALEVPDNWSMGLVYNVSIEEMQNTMENALKNGVTIAWASDVSEKGFSMKDGLAIVPVHDSLVPAKGQVAPYSERQNHSKSAFDQPYPEKKITPELRQIAFDKQLTTDDHGMHIVGLYTDQNGTKYFKVKNSWGTDWYLKGYFLASENYVQYKTTCIMVPKSVVPKKLAEKLDLN